MYRDKERYGQDPTTVMRSKTMFDAPLKWKSGRVFTCSWSDFFIEQADPWRDEAWDVIRRTPHLTYQVLTKRPENIAARLPKDWGEGWPHVQLGVSVESQNYADERIPLLLEIPASVRFLSVEPMLEAVDLRAIKSRPIQPSNMQSLYIPLDDLDWVICGGESGPGARPFDINWAADLLGQCQVAGVPFFMKQWGSKAHSGGIEIEYTGKGDNPAEWPEYMRVQEFPGLQ
jgi:protein gp37